MSQEKGVSSMLRLNNIVKTYTLGDDVHRALDGVTLAFDKQEFVSILGASGSGKTTLLNIIGGLDTYNSGDMIISGKSTRTFKAKDWDSYRNGTIGFVFQSYNLITHLSVVENVKMALSISGVSSKESHNRAVEALTAVGLEKHIHKKPNQLSGGQMQRVAIARALVTNPDIILADEPTGALDSVTSIQIMELIKTISRDKLVIMVTHNPEIAHTYSDRIISVKDGKVIEDTKPYVETELIETYTSKKTSMSFIRAVQSSFKNLLTKKTRTILTTIAASIGIISIATVLAISNGMNGYIETTQKDTLATLPISVSTVNTTFALPSEEFDNEQVNTNVVTLSPGVRTHYNHLLGDPFKNGQTFLSYMREQGKDYYKYFSVDTGYQLKVLVKNQDDTIEQIDQSANRSFSATQSFFATLPEDSGIVLDQYDIVASKDQPFVYPVNNQVILFLDERGQLTQRQMSLLGFSNTESVAYDKILGKTFSVINNNQYFTEINGMFIPKTPTTQLFDEGEKLEIVAIAKPKNNAVTSFSGVIGYTQAFLTRMLEKEAASHIVDAQKQSPTKSVVGIASESFSQEMYQSLMQQLGGVDDPATIHLYAQSFENREALLRLITEYNQKLEDMYGKDSSEYREYMIAYTDLAKTVTNAFSSVITAVTVILTAFSAISLVVSSVMIGILTYVSVVERTKEIGILRAIGARTKDISRIFNAEAGLLGFISGMLGIGISYLLTVPINHFIQNDMKIDGFYVSLDWQSGIVLVLLSIVLTLIAGYIPSKIASRKNPVEALRSE